MTTSVPRELEAVDAVFAAEQAVQRARRVVEEFQEVVTSALRVLDDAELDSAKSRLSDRGGFYMESAAEHLGRLQTRCNELPNLATELDTHLGRAAVAVDEARDRLSQVDTSDPALAADVEQLQPQVAIPGEVVNLARPIAQLASDHVESARQTSREVTAPGLLEPQTLERSLRAAGSQLDEPTRTYACWRPSSSARPARPTSRSGSPRRSPTTLGRAWTPTATTPASARQARGTTARPPAACRAETTRRDHR